MISMENKTAMRLLRDWIRTNGELSEDGKKITYDTTELESKIAELSEVEKKNIVEAFKAAITLQGSEEWKQSEGEEYYSTKFNNQK